MRFFTAVFTAIALAAPVFSSPTPLRTVEKFEGKTSGKYIVKLKEGASKAAVIGKLRNSTVTHDWKLLNGFAGNLDSETVNLLRASPDVEYIAEDGIVHTFATQTNAPWGLARLSQDAKLTNQNTGALTFSYTYDNTAGSGVDIYIIGKASFHTGVYTAHSQFGGRARWGATFGGYANADGNGHGTHVAGTAAGSQYGVAKAANIIAVKVLSDGGSGSVSDIVSGLNWVANSAASSGRPSVASLSLGGGASTALDNAVTALTNVGIHVTVAAGNSNTNAGSTSPARAPAVITVGASTIADARASFSNYGAVVDVFAPGQNVISSWIGSTTATNNISGTSMATPHVAGLVAYLIAKNGNSSPAAISTLIKNLSVKNALTGIPSGTVNYLANNA
ncbi:Cuticle-degrading protease [Hypsizygus marmoreus]|uniref:Cuticle-degrading protease n=1 Tax=Hypsizygus marmoreus TaxID=39966 RepID=A0A369J854_HYPMA|nr:Cuticle-degrading protease [Hypsizygus marmoreus]